MTAWMARGSALTEGAKLSMQAVHGFKGESGCGCIPMLMVAWREMTSGDRGVSIEASSLVRSCGRHYVQARLLPHHLPGGIQVEGARPASIQGAEPCSSMEAALAVQLVRTQAFLQT